MKKELKEQVIAAIKANIAECPNFYIVDIAGLNAEDTAKLRRDCFNEGIKLTVVKNTLFHKVIKDAQNSEMDLLVPALEGNSAIMYCEAPATPAKLINIKSREELIGEIIGMLQSPLQNVISALQNGGGQTIAGLVKTLEEKENK